MEIRDGFIVYTPPAPAASPGLEPATRGAWAREVEELLALYEGAPFSPVEGTAMQAPTPARVVAERDGDVLTANKILKPDQFPGIHRAEIARDQPRIEGAPNYRALSVLDKNAEVSERTIHGTAQPTVSGIRGVLAQTGGKAVWTSLREEPVVYIHGQPFNVRDAEHVYVNEVNPGASAEQVEAVEDRLKADVLREAARNGGAMLIHEEHADGTLAPVRVQVDEKSVQTSREVFDGLRKEGFDVDYARIPITDEKRPDDHDFDAVVDRLKDVPPDANIVFNCHQGRGRTTAAMVTAGLLRRAQADAPGKLTDSPPVREDIREQGGYQPREYRTILSLCKLLENEPATPEQAEKVVHDYSGLRDLRDSISKYRAQAHAAATEDARTEARERGRAYLQRYFYLSAFDAYAREQAPTGFSEPFSKWMHQRPELQNILRNSESALGLAG
ncbi:MAG: hypothetical protein FJX76_03540 [Armatimonadetes bacterium]|nr:hypothetical protein [Armatimonadota bacterium]